MFLFRNNSLCQAVKTERLSERLNLRAPDSPQEGLFHLTLESRAISMNRINCQRWTLIAACLVICNSAIGQINCVRPGDEIWLISARQLGGCHAGEMPCQRLCNGHWQQSCFTELVQANDHRPECAPVIFVHGYQTDLGDAQRRGLEVYQNLFASCQSDQPIRYVIWAWKSERESRRIVREFKEKAQHAAQLGDAFAMTLNWLQSKPPTIIAYSLGAEISLSALVQSNVYSGVPVQLVVIAAATDCGFSSCCFQMQHCGHIARSYVFSNRGDIAIRAARISCRLATRKRQEKFEQVAPMFPQQLGEVCIIDITKVMTCQHSIVRYTSLPIVKDCINELVTMNRDLFYSSQAGGIGQSIEHTSAENLDSCHQVCVRR